MLEILQALNEFQGIIGAILGSVTTLIVSDMLKKKGKLKKYIIAYNDKFEKFKDVGCSMKGKSDDDFYGYSIKYILQVYNNSDTPKIMRDFKIVFLKNLEEIYAIVPDDEETKKHTHYSVYIDKMEVLNIDPRKIYVLKHSIYIDYDMLNVIEGSNKVELQYKDEKNKTRKILLSNKVITSNDYGQI